MCRVRPLVTRATHADFTSATVPSESQLVRIRYFLYSWGRRNSTTEASTLGKSLSAFSLGPHASSVQLISDGSSVARWKRALPEFSDLCAGTDGDQCKDLAAFSCIPPPSRVLMESGTWERVHTGSWTSWRNAARAYGRFFRSVLRAMGILRTNASPAWPEILFCSAWRLLRRRVGWAATSSIGLRTSRRETSSLDL